MSYHIPNVASCKNITRLTWNPLFGAYLPLSTLEHLPDLEDAMHRFRYPIVFRDLNMYLDKARILRSQQLVDFLVEYGLIDLVRHFHQSRRFRNLNTWSQVRQGNVLWSRYNHITRKDRRRFELVEIQDMRNFLSDYLTLRARLLR